MSTIASRIRRLMDERELSYSALSAATGIPKSALQRYATGQTEKIPLGRIEAIAAACGVSAASLMGWPETPDRPTPRLRSIPLLGQTACGAPIHSPADADSFVPIDETFASGFAVDFALEARGDSMSGIGIRNGDIVYFVAQEIVDNGQIAAVVIEDAITLKRVYYDRDGEKLILQAENPTVPPQVYTGDALEQIRILGRAVAHMRRL